MRNVLNLELYDDCIKLMFSSIKSGELVVRDQKVVTFNERIADNGKILNVNLVIEEILNFKTENSIRCNRISVLLNSSQMIIRNINANLKTITECYKYFELNMHSIFPIDSLSEYTLDFKVNKMSTKPNNLIITAVAVPNDLLNQYCPILQKLKLKPVLFDIYENSIVRLFKDISLNEDGVIITLDFYTYCCYVVFLYHDYVVDRIYVPINNGSLDALFIDKLRMHINAYRLTSIFGDIKCFYLLGKKEFTLEKLLFDEFNIAVKQSQLTTVHKSGRFLAGLLPLEYKKKIRLRNAIFKIHITFILISLSFLLIVTVFELSHLKKREQLTYLNSLYEKYQPSKDIISRYTLLSQELKQYEEIEKHINSSMFAEIKDLDILASYLPEDCYYNNFSSHNNIISISGISKSYVSIARYLEKLNDIKRYKDVVLKELNSSNETDINFLIELTIAEVKKEED